MSGIEEIELEGEGLERFVDYVAQNYGRLGYALIIDKEIEITPTISRMGGLPYWDFSKEYPCDEQGQPLCFLGQVNLGEVAAVPLDSKLQALKDKASGGVLPEQGLLQFFALRQGQYGCTFAPDNSQCMVVYTPHITEDQDLSMGELKERLIAHGLDLEQVSNVNVGKSEDDYWPIEGAGALKFKAVSSLPWQAGDIDEQFEIVAEAALEVFDLDEEALEELDATDLLEEILEEPENIDYVRHLSTEERDCTIGHLLGYPNFIQETPLYNPEWARFDTVLLCLDRNRKVGEGFSMMWADSGVADFMISGDKLKQLDFSDIFYTWECY